jgi:hypothetical protein
MQSDPHASMAASLALAEECHSASELAISSWHERQAREQAAEASTQLGDLAAAAAIYERNAVQHRGALNGHGHSAAQLFAEAALLRFQLGETAAAIALVKEALRFFGQFPGPNGFLVNAMSAWIEHERSKTRP